MDLCGIEIYKQNWILQFSLILLSYVQLLIVVHFYKFVHFTHFCAFLYKKISVCVHTVNWKYSICNKCMWLWLWFCCTDAKCSVFGLLQRWHSNNFWITFIASLQINYFVVLMLAYLFAWYCLLLFVRFWFSIILIAMKCPRFVVETNVILELGRGFTPQWNWRSLLWKSHKPPLPKA